jgi:polyisoprenoid-binding protein YceI
VIGPRSPPDPSGHRPRVRSPFGNVRAGFGGSTTINRKDVGITVNAALETGGVPVSEKVGLNLDISAIRQA